MIEKTKRRQGVDDKVRMGFVRRGWSKQSHTQRITEAIVPSSSSSSSGEQPRGNKKKKKKVAVALNYSIPMLRVIKEKKKKRDCNDNRKEQEACCYSCCVFVEPIFTGLYFNVLSPRNGLQKTTSYLGDTVSLCLSPKVDLKQTLYSSYLCFMPNRKPKQVMCKSDPNMTRR